ncbi:ABC transporter substrate-binding protein [Candidatus Magnetomonas plexicatena]|uniref:ABC transporter substrate-binding protein n=1 Tax=Candidatus Magnetomonas plexicatena TaxID=2552947 RepID=UPI0011001A22|nr:hypothetical protein E2O03_005345 [Nitrospirales bacterium LBB_01]
MRQKIYYILIICFIAEIVLMLLPFNLSKKRVLILHSYDDSYGWVKDVNVGINRVLKNKTHYYVRWHYLDTKRHPWREFKESAGKIARNMIDKWQPDVIIAVDDDAQEYVAKYYNNKPKVSVVFSGVNNEIEDYQFDKAQNVTGILERLPLEAVKEALETFSSRAGKTGIIKVFFIGDKSETVMGDEKWIRQYNWSPLELTGTSLVSTLDEWKEVIDNASKSADYIMVSNYRKILRSKGTTDLVPPKELIDFTIKHSKVPIIGTNAFFGDDGGMIAIATSPFEQGEVAAKMAVDILDNKTLPKNIPIAVTSQFVVSINDSKVKEYHFDLPKVYEASARASNHFYK